MTEKVIIVGCGWLGQQIAPALDKAGLHVFGSRRTAASAALLPQPIHGITLPLTEPVLTDELLALFRDAWVLCSIPPGGRVSGVASNYLEVLTILQQICQQAEIKGGIHISSTGVYQGLSGVVDETATLDTKNARVALLAAGEQLLQEDGWLTLRLAGLMGPGRHPGRFVQGKILSGALHPVNMVHSNDVAQAIIKLFTTWPAARQCYNLCSPKRVLKRNFYQTAAMALGLAPETIAFADTELGLEPARQVDSQAITRDTSFTYQFYDASAALAYC